MYRVIHFFTDLKDNSHPYNVGDKYPRKGVNPTTRRIEELSSKFNLQGKPLIEFVEDVAETVTPEEVVEKVEKAESTEKTYTKTEIFRMSTADLRVFGAKSGIANAENMSGTDLKKLLVVKLGL